MGSRRTHEDRLERLREAGLTEEEIGRLSSPIGLDLGARTPEETAISIAAEIIAGRWGGSGERLAGTDGRIHHDGSGRLHRVRRRRGIAGRCGLAGCTSDGAPAPTPPGRRPTRRRRRRRAPAPRHHPPPPSAPSPTTRPPPVHDPVSLAALMRQNFGPTRIVRQRLPATTDAYTRYEVTYRSGDAHRLRGAARPARPGSVPRRSCSTTATSSRRSTPPARGSRASRTGWPVPVSRCCTPTTAGTPPPTRRRRPEPREPSGLRDGRDQRRPRAAPRAVVDPDRMAMLGRSMGGGVTLNALVARPGLVDAAVIYASVSSDFLDNLQTSRSPTGPRRRRRSTTASVRRSRAPASTAACRRAPTSTGSPSRC